LSDNKALKYLQIGQGVPVKVADFSLLSRPGQPLENLQIESQQARVQHPRVYY
jgi:hypothetical protein